MTRSNVRGVLIFWTFVVAALSYLDRANISIAATPMQANFGLTNLWLAVAFSVLATGRARRRAYADG